MALSEASEVAICKILLIPKYVLDEQIALMGARLTATVQADIEANIADWDSGIGTKYTRLMPTESNKGVKTDPDGRRRNIQQEIAILLERPDWASGSGNYLPRG